VDVATCRHVAATTFVICTAFEPAPARGAAVAQVNPILRGRVNYFRVGNARQAFNKVQYHVERKVRRFAAKRRKRTGFGWKRWSSDIVYGSWGLFRDYPLAFASATARTG